MRFVLSSLMVVFLLGVTAALAAKAPYAGKFSDGKLTVELAQSGETLSGTFTLNNHHYPAIAHDE